MANKLSLSPIIDISVNLSARAAARKGFNIALICGKSQVLPQLDRIRTYTSADALLDDGFTNTSEEYQAALLYFSANITPTRLMVGQKYESETWLEAAQKCRAQNSEWYVFCPLGTDDADIAALAAWAESADPDTVLAYTTHGTDNLSAYTADEDDGDEDPPTEIFKTLSEKNYRRSFGQYCGQDDTPDAVVATMGYAMGANRGTNNSSYTLAYKTLPGVTTDDLTETQITYVCGTPAASGVNGNCYITRADTYDILQQGRMADGSSFDEILQLDMLKNDIVLNIMDLLTSKKKIPQTESGLASIVNVINTACDKYVNTGFIAPGKWNGGEVLNLEDGTYLTDGYLVQAEEIDDQSQADRDARKAPPIYVSIKLAGAIEYITIEVNVNR